MSNVNIEVSSGPVKALIWLFVKPTNLIKVEKKWWLWTVFETTFF